MTSIEQTAYARFKRLITAHELHLFFAPTREKAAWAVERMDSDGPQLALPLALESHQRMGRFPNVDEYPEKLADYLVDAGLCEEPQQRSQPTAFLTSALMRCSSAAVSSFRA